DAIEFVLVEEELFLAGSRLVDVDRRVDAAVGEATVEDEVGVAGALELFEDDFVHARPGVDQRRRDDGERAATLDVARRAEEALGLLERVRVDTAGEDLAGVRYDDVVGARQTGDRVEQDDHVATML